VVTDSTGGRGELAEPWPCRDPGKSPGQDRNVAEGGRVCRRLQLQIAEAKAGG
jgi:hypothetical protein